MKQGIFKLLTLFLALFLAICACKIELLNPDVPESENGVLYYKEVTSGEWVIVGIAKPDKIGENRAAFAPKNGYWYVIGIGSESNAGDKPVSMGTIQVDGSKLTFTPFADMDFPSSSSFTGTMGSDYLVMDSIPGKNYSGGIRLSEGGSYNFVSSDDPWGTGGGLPDIPGAL